MAALDRDAWGRAVVEEEYGRLQQEVAASVRAGNRDEALRRISVYETRNSAANVYVQSPEVTQNLSSLGYLSSQVDDAFSGADQESKQKVLAKERQATGHDARRVGAKKSAGGGGQ